MKKSYIISTAIVLGLLTPVALGETDNNLVQLDLKRSSTNSVDVTLVTSDNYNDNVLVRKKSDNKYVILVPKVQSSGFSASNLSGVKDLISDVDVKTVDDTSGGYTKVTLITTKPLDIKTRTVKSKPVTSDQREYNTLIAQANAIKNTVSEAPKLREQKTEVTVNKAPKQDTKVQPKQETKKIKTPKNDIKLSEITPETIEKQRRKTNLKQLIDEVKSEKALEKIPEKAPAEPMPVVNETIQDLKEMPSANESIFSSITHKIKSLGIKASNKTPSKLPRALGAIAILLATIAIASKFFKRAVVSVQNIENSYSENIPDNSETNPESYENIVNNDELSWKEKYQLYLDKSASPVSRGENKGNYSFIKVPSSKAIEAKRQELEKMVSEISSDDFEIVEDNNLYSEDSAISKAIKFKAFENTTNSLSISKRDRIKSRFKKYEVEIPLQEQKTIELDDSPLNSNPRSLKDANLQVSDVDKRRIKYKPKDYIMSSVDEYLNIVDSEKTTKIPTVSTPVSKPSENSYLKGTIVKSGYKISPNKGFYIVNKNGKNSLIGKINDKITVLKNFDNNDAMSVQVRHDNENVYMVKAGDFKSLVEINNENMGVLIEL